MINVVLTVGGFALVKGVFLMLFARENRQMRSISQLDGNHSLPINRNDLNRTDHKELRGADVAA